MNFETGYSEVWAAKRNPSVNQAAGNMQPAQQQISDDDMSFWDFVDVVNPLQHIPFVNTVYRDLTGDTIKPSTQMAGSILFGGPFAMVAGAYNAMFEQTGGMDMANTMVAALSGDSAVEVEELAPLNDTGGVMLASADGGVAGGVGAGAAVTSEISVNTDGGVHHALDASLGDTGDAMAQQVLLAAADAYASERSMDAFLTLASGAPISATPAAAGAPVIAQPRAPFGLIQMADKPVGEEKVAEEAEQDAKQQNLQLASIAADDAAAEQAVEPRRTLAASEASPMPFNADEVRRFNRALPLYAGASSRKAEIKAGDVAEAAARLAAAREREAKLTPAVAKNDLPIAEPALITMTQTIQAKPQAPAHIEDPFGRNISSDNLAAKMRQALDKYQASNSLNGPGV